MNKTLKIVVIATVVVLAGTISGVGFAVAQGISAWDGMMAEGFGGNSAGWCDLPRSWEPVT